MLSFSQQGLGSLKKTPAKPRPPRSVVNKNETPLSTGRKAPGSMPVWRRSERQKAPRKPLAVFSVVEATKSPVSPRVMAAANVRNKRSKVTCTSHCASGYWEDSGSVAGFSAYSDGSESPDGFSTYSQSSGFTVNFPFSYVPPCPGFRTKAPRRKSGFHCSPLFRSQKFA